MAILGCNLVLSVQTTKRYPDTAVPWENKKSETYFFFLRGLGGRSDIKESARLRLYWPSINIAASVFICVFDIVVQCFSDWHSVAPTLEHKTINTHTGAGHCGAALATVQSRSVIWPEIILFSLCSYLYYFIVLISYFFLSCILM